MTWYDSIMCSWMQWQLTSIITPQNEENPPPYNGSGRSPGKGIGYPLQYSWASLVAQMVKNLLAVWDTWVQSLDWEDPLEKEMATRSSTLAWKIPWMEEPCRLQSMGSQRVGHDWATSVSYIYIIIIYLIILQQKPRQHWKAIFLQLKIN